MESTKNTKAPKQQPEEASDVSGAEKPIKPDTSKRADVRRADVFEGGTTAPSMARLDAFEKMPKSKKSIEANQIETPKVVERQEERLFASNGLDEKALKALAGKLADKKIRYSDINSLFKVENIETTPIQYAVSKGSVLLVKLLLDNDYIDANKLDGNANHVLEIAVTQDNVDVLNVLLSSEKVNKSYVNRKTGRTPLHLAAEKGFLESVEALTKSMAKQDCDRKDKAGHPPAYQAVQNGHMDVLTHLAEECSIDLQMTYPDGKTLAHVAGECNQKEILGYLSKKGVDLNVQDKFGYTPMHSAVWAKVEEGDDSYDEVIKFLGSRSDVERKSVYGNTAGYIDSSLKENADKNIDRTNAVREKFMRQFHEFGPMTPDGVAFSLFAKKINAVELDGNGEFSTFAGQVAKIKNAGRAQIIDFGFYYDGYHQLCGQVKTGEKELSIMFIDSLANKMFIMDCVSTFRERFPNSDVFFNSTKLQADNPSCHSFGIELLQKLKTQNNYLPKGTKDMFAYAENNRVKGSETNDGIRMFRLPARLASPMQAPLPRILEAVFEEELIDAINKRKQTLAELVKATQDQGINKRLEYKLENIRKKNWEKIKDMSENDIENAIKARRIDGFVF